MSTLNFRHGLIMVSIGSACLASAYQVNVGAHAPDFTAMSMSGERVFLRDMQKQGPVFLYFIRDGQSPCTQETPYIEQIIKSYGTTRSNWYGVLNSKGDKVRSFVAEYKPSFRILRDEDMSVVHSLGIENSPTVMQIGTKGRVLGLWRGFSASHLKEINVAMAKANHQKVQNIDFSEAPTTTLFGENFQPRAAK